MRLCVSVGMRGKEGQSTPPSLSRMLCFAFIFKVVIIRYDQMAHDREIVHMITARADIQR